GRGHENSGGLRRGGHRLSDEAVQGAVRARADTRVARARRRGFGARHMTVPLLLAAALAAAALWLGARPRRGAAGDRRRLAARIVAGLVTVYGLVALVDGSIARSTALDVSLLGGALLLLGWEASWAFRLAQLMALWPATIALVSLLTRLYGNSSVHTSLRAPVDAVVVLALGAGVFCARPGHGLIGIVMTRRAGGALARR